MSKTYVSCYSSPLSETTLPVNDKQFKVWGRKEVQAWLLQLRRTFPKHKFDFVIKEIENSEPEMYQVVLEYENTEKGQTEAFKIVEDLPYNWDDDAKRYLGIMYNDYIMRLKCPEDFQEEQKISPTKDPQLEQKS